MGGTQMTPWFLTYVYEGADTGTITETGNAGKRGTLEGRS